MPNHRTIEGRLFSEHKPKGLCPSSTGLPKIDKDRATIVSLSPVISSPDQNTAGRFNGHSWKITMKIPFSGDYQWFFVKPVSALSFQGIFNTGHPEAKIIMSSQTLGYIELVREKKIPVGSGPFCPETTSKKILEDMVGQIDTYLSKLDDEVQQNLL